jgi:uncharacterized membrane protein
MQYYAELFNWWVISISFSVTFMTIIAVYLYVNSRTKRRQINRATGEKSRLIGNFVFVWILLILLALYIATIALGSYELYVLGNIIVDLVLIAYSAMNKLGKAETTQQNR